MLVHLFIGLMIFLQQLSIPSTPLICIAGLLVYLFWLTKLRMLSILAMLFCVGLLLNLLVISLNGGKMPTFSQGSILATEDRYHSVATETTRLPLLANRFALEYIKIDYTEGMSPLDARITLESYIASPGDILATTSYALFLFFATVHLLWFVARKIWQLKLKPNPA